MFTSSGSSFLIVQSQAFCNSIDAVLSFTKKIFFVKKRYQLLYPGIMRLTIEIDGKRIAIYYIIMM